MILRTKNIENIVQINTVYNSNSCNTHKIRGILWYGFVKVCSPLHRLKHSLPFLQFDKNFKITADWSRPVYWCSIRSIRAAKLRENLVKINPGITVLPVLTPSSGMSVLFLIVETTRSGETLSSCLVNHARISTKHKNHVSTNCQIRSAREWDYDG